MFIGLINWYTAVGPAHILLNCPILPSSVDSVATYSRKKTEFWVRWWRHLACCTQVAWTQKRLVGST